MKGNDGQKVEVLGPLLARERIRIRQKFSVAFSLVFSNAEEEKKTRKTNDLVRH